ncbi:hypothetical protein J6590_101392, partial [Homalodisca vitripennis]
SDIDNRKLPLHISAAPLPTAGCQTNISRFTRPDPLHGPSIRTDYCSAFNYFHTSSSLVCV